MTIYFTSDLHFSHEKVSLTRGFLNAVDHDVALETTLRETLTRDDQLWILGDLSSGSKSSEGSALSRLDWVKYRTGATLHLIPGNHDSCHPKHRDAYKHQKEFMEVFDSVQAFARRKFDGVEFLLSHYPYYGDHTEEDRDQQYRLRFEGLPLLHGHTHQEEVVGTPGDLAFPLYQFSVGLDAWKGQIVSLESLVELMKSYERVGS